MMRRRSVGDSLKSLGLKTALAYLDSDPEKNIPKLVDWLIKIDKEGKYVGSQAETVQKALHDGDNNWFRLIKSVWTEIDDGGQKKDI